MLAMDLAAGIAVLAAFAFFVLLRTSLPETARRP
jgi:hypothetical protein